MSTTGRNLGTQNLGEGSQNKYIFFIRFLSPSITLQQIEFFLRNLDQRSALTSLRTALFLGPPSQKKSPKLGVQICIFFFLSITPCKVQLLNWKFNQKYFLRLSSTGRNLGSQNLGEGSQNKYIFFIRFLSPSITLQQIEFFLWNLDYRSISTSLRTALYFFGFRTLKKRPSNWEFKYVFFLLSITPCKVLLLNIILVFISSLTDQK